MILQAEPTTTSFSLRRRQTVQARVPLAARSVSRQAAGRQTARVDETALLSEGMTWEKPHAKARCSVQNRRDRKTQTTSQWQKTATAAPLEDQSAVSSQLATGRAAQARQGDGQAKPAAA